MKGSGRSRRLLYEHTYAASGKAGQTSLRLGLRACWPGLRKRPSDWAVQSGWLARARTLRLDVMPNDITLLSEDDLDSCVA